MVLRPHSSVLSFTAAVGAAAGGALASAFNEPAWIATLAAAGGSLVGAALGHAAFSAGSDAEAKITGEKTSMLRKDVEELRASLKASEQVNTRIMECSNDCVKIVDGEGKLLFMNARGRELLEFGSSQDVTGSLYFDLLTSEALEEVRQSLQRAQGGHTCSFRVYCPTAKGNPRWWHVTTAPLERGGARDFKCLVISRDITEHIQVEKALRESEEAFRKVFEEGPVAMVLGGRDFRIEKVNNAFCRMLGYREREVVGLRLWDISHPDDGDQDARQLERLLSGEMPSFEMEKRYLTRRKKVVWGHLTLSVVRDPEARPRYTVAMIENIDDRKQAQEQLLAYQEQLQSLASKLSLSEERERRRIATNLHDRIGQSLAFAKMKLAALLKNGVVENESVGQIRELIEQAIGDTRSLTFELSPPVLYELGLVAAVEWLARNIQQEHGITTRFHDDGQPKPLDEDFRIVLFQAVRELLVNVVKHARASHAQVLIRRDGDALRIIVEDDGVGFDFHSMRNRSDQTHGFGLFSVRERLDYLGGRVKIRSEAGLGTRVTLLAPLRLTEGNQLNHEHSDTTGRRSQDDA